MKTKLGIFITLCCYTCFVSAQGAFQNLNFEAAMIPSGTAQGTALSALPSWTPSTVVYDGVSLGGALVTINDSMTPLLNFSPLQGKYSVILFAGPDIGAAGSSSISQTGMVPAFAKSIQMDIAFPLGGSILGAFTVALDGQEIPMTPLLSLSGYTVYGGDIAAYAGDVKNLTITQFPPLPPTVPPSAVELDNIVFSPNSIPEPSTWALLLCGAGAIIFRHRNRQKCDTK